MEILLFKNGDSTFQNGLLHFKMGILLFKNGNILHFKIGNSTDILESKTHFINKLTVENVEFTDYFFCVVFYIALIYK